MKLTKKDVEHVAHLARVRVSEAEKDTFVSQLSSILDYVNQLNEVSTEGVAVTAQVAGRENALRPDVVEECDPATRAAIIKNAPESEDNLFKTPSVFE